MKSYNLLLLLGATSIITACSSEDPATNDDAREISFICSYDSGVRAGDTSFEGNDRIGVYMTSAGTALQLGGNELNNELFSYNGSVWTSSRKVYWDEGEHDVYAYYPYMDSVNDTEDCEFSVSTDQSTHADYTASDFLWASATGVEASASPVSLKFSHRMSRAVVKIVKGDDYEGEIPSDCEVYIHNTVTDALVDLASGSTSRQSMAGTNSIRMMKVADDEYKAIVVPQNIESRRPLVEIVTQGVSYLMEGKLSFKQGYSHTLIVTLSKNPTQTKIEIGGSIGGWD